VCNFLPAWRWPAPILVVVVCLSVCPSVCLSQVGVLLKWLNVGSCKQRHVIVQGLQFSDAKDLGKTQTGSSTTEAPKCRWGRLNANVVAENWRLSTWSVVNVVLSQVSHTEHPACLLTFSCRRIFMKFCKGYNHFGGEVDLDPATLLTDAYLHCCAQQTLPGWCLCSLWTPWSGFCILFFFSRLHYGRLDLASAA